MTTHHQLLKRDGTLVPFDARKITAAIARALAAADQAARGRAEALTKQVVQRLPAAQTPTVEQVQDQVEEVLMGAGLSATAKAYILYRQRRAEVRRAKRLLGVTDELKLTVNAAHVLKARYLLKDDQGHVVETPDQLLRRVARAVAVPEADHGASPREVAAVERGFYELLASLDFLPNSPTLMNAGTEVGQLSACYVLPVEDSIPGIFDAVKFMAQVHKSGGGTGFSFSRLRPRGDLVNTTRGIASGPLSFMRIFDVTTEVIKQGGRRRGANMAILRCDHPDVLQFIGAKDRDGDFSNFNLSVGVTDEFMAALEADGSYPLRNPRSGQELGRLRAREVFNLIVTQAWRTGDPGLVFLDAIERANPTPGVGVMEATNPCGEQPLLPWESCNLGSVNLAHMVTPGGELDRQRLRSTVDVAVRFLDNVIDANVWPLEQTAAITRANRKIGLGVMGLADALLRMGLPYDSERALAAADEIASILQQQAHRASEALAERRGSFPNHELSIFAGAGRPRRNATVTSIAPTGTISIIAGCSSGIEPLFAVSFVRNVLEGSRLVETNPIFESVARERGFFSEELVDAIARGGSVQAFEEIPADVRRLFVTALDIDPEWHVRMQATFQRHCDNAVSKTINFAAHAAPQQVEQAFLLAHRLGCKGITVYRYGSKAEQVLSLGGDGASLEQGRGELTTADAEYAGGCPTTRCDG